MGFKCTNAGTTFDLAFNTCDCKTPPLESVEQPINKVSDNKMRNKIKNDFPDTFIFFIIFSYNCYRNIILYKTILLFLTISNRNI